MEAGARLSARGATESLLGLTESDCAATIEFLASVALPMTLRSETSRALFTLNGLRRPSIALTCVVRRIGESSRHHASKTNADKGAYPFEKYRPASNNDKKHPKKGTDNHEDSHRKLFPHTLSHSLP